jgi:hypothetical protein
VKISQLATDPSLVPSNLKPLERSVRAGFITIRLRAMLKQDPSLQASGKPGEVADGSVGGPNGVKAKLAGEVTKAAAAAAQIATRMTNDEAAGKLLPLDAADDGSTEIDAKLLDEYVRPNPVGLDAPTTDGLKAKRKELVTTISWWAMAVHDPLQQPGKLDDLHMIVDRRLRVAERMLYYVARRAKGRVLDFATIRPAPGGPWPDGTKRVFEYPNVKRKPFAALCQADPNGDCQGADMVGWSEEGDTLAHPWQVSNAARNYWNVLPPPFPGDYPTIVYNTGQGSGPPIVAVQKLFEGSTDFKQRNYLACDHVLHALHIEGLVSALVNRGQGASFNTLVTGKPAGSNWLRLSSPWNSGDKGEAFGTFGALPFIANPDESAYFEHKRIPLIDLQVGDHLIVYNHPVFDRLVENNTWRLENAVVIQVYPKTLLQGHGMMPETAQGMRSQMLEECRDGLVAARQLVEEKLAAQQPPAATGFPTFKLTRGRRAAVVRRVPPASSEYTAEHQKADWWVCWIPGEDKGEAALANSTTSARRDVARNEQKVEFVTPWDVSANMPAIRTAVRAQLKVTTQPATNDALTFFPLWEPAKRQGGVSRNAQNKIDRIQEVKIDEPMVSVGGWYIPLTTEPRDEVTVIRPKV